MKTTLAVCMLLFAVAAVPAAELPGRQVYTANCAMCHQDQAQGAAGLAPALKGSQWEKLGKARAYAPGVLLAGLHGPISTDEGSFTGVMPPQNRLSDEQIAAAANYLVLEVNGQAGAEPVTAAEVAAWRAKPPSVAELRAARKQALAK